MSAAVRLHWTALKAATTLTIDTGAVTATQQYHVIAAESGTTDDLDTINVGATTLEVNSVTYRPVLYITADAGDTITVKHGTGNVVLPSSTDVDITENDFLSLVYDGTNWRGHVGGSGGGGAPTDATYITQTPNGTLSAEQALSALASGVLYSTTSTGVLSTATEAQLRAGFGNVTANTVLSGPASGSATTPTYRALVVDDLPADVAPVSQGRLSLSNTLPVTTSDVTAATTLYYHPYKGSKVRLYDGSNWNYHTIPDAGVSIAIPASTDTNYDVYAYDNSGTLALELVAWTNDTTRATARVLQDGVKVKSGDTSRTYLGVVRTTGVSGQCEDSESKRFIENYYNPVLRKLKVTESTNTWTYSTASTYRQANASSANQVAAVIGDDEHPVYLSAIGFAFSTSGNSAAFGVGVDKTNGSDSDLFGTFVGSGGGQFTSVYHDHPGVGYHYFAWVETIGSANTVTFYGDSNAPTIYQFGMVGWKWG